MQLDSAQTSQSDNTVSQWHNVCIAQTSRPLGLKSLGCFVVLQTRWRMVVLPALARPMIRTRKRPVFLRKFAARILWLSGSTYSARVTSRHRGMVEITAYPGGPHLVLPGFWSSRNVTCWAFLLTFFLLMEVVVETKTKTHQSILIYCFGL